MELLPIAQTLADSKQFLNEPLCAETLEMTVNYFGTIGYDPPWIGYYASDGSQLVGSAAFKGKPKNDTVEIAYGVFDPFRNKGYGATICRLLVEKALREKPNVRITARTLPQGNHSTRLLLKNNFQWAGTVNDPDDGVVWEWVYQRKPGSFNLQPVLKGELLTLRPLEHSDAGALYEIAADPLMWEQHPEKDRYKPEVFARFMESALHTQCALAVIDNLSGRIIGCSRYYGLNEIKKEIVIGYTFLKREFWGRHYNTEMKKRMLNHAFTSVETVTFSIGENNMRSRRAVEKLGARLRETTGGSVVYALEKNDWQAKNEPAV